MQDSLSLPSQLYSFAVCSLSALNVFRKFKYLFLVAVLFHESNVFVVQLDLILVTES